MTHSIIALFLLASVAGAATTWTGAWTVSTAIPDNDDAGFTDTIAFDNLDLTDIVSVSVALHFTGGWNGDLFVYLAHDTGFAVLLNRPGRTATALDGAASLGLNITLRDDAELDIHTAIPMSGGPVTGTYQPDGRAADPLLVLNTSPRTEMLSSFSGLNPNGTWTLFVADQSTGAVSTLQNWSLEIVAVPEPSAALALLASSALLLRRRRATPGS